MRKVSVYLGLLLLINAISVTKAFGNYDSASLTLNSESAILIDERSGQVLYEKNGDKQVYPASLTKIATAIYAIEKGNLEEIFTVSQNARDVDGTRVYLEAGEQVSLKKLIQGMLINSGNDAGIAIAEHLDGSVEKFSTNINKYLKTKVGVHDTNFKNPHGLFKESHVTTAYDMAKITQYAMKNKEFREIFGTKTLDWKGKSWETTLINHHKLMREIPYEGVTGGKTGFVDQSGQTLVTTAKRGNLSLIAVSFKALSQTAAYDDAVQLLDYGYDNYRSSKVAKGTLFNSEKGVRYQLTEDFYFTQLNDERVVKKVTNDGNLQILNQEQIVLNSMKLVEEKQFKPASSEDVSSSKTEKLSFFNQNFSIIFVFMLLFLAIIGIVYKRKKEY
ncbi:D-alanyl-D-alanine carboxypeptidase family protein [Domibacillus robiginosus]|uniref:D-alanyl-D-alanine carboxypeptidase family protein n=1 Tax=Domibacillus robiginosus TaxID=1071054 RepID=UPI00067A965F|nr:D-alanyl-D-alanine carboxypeptidase family protein [Domibacillus robiginosus]